MPYRIQKMNIAQGVVRAYFLFDVADTIDLAQLAGLGGERPRVPTAYLQFPIPPLVLPLSNAAIDDLDCRARIKFYDYGVISVLLTFAVSGGWREVTGLADKARGDERISQYAHSLAMRIREEQAAAFDEPHDPLIEDYFIIEINGFSQPLSARQLLDDHSSDIAKLLLGEQKTLSVSETNEALRNQFSYYEDDLTIVQWDTAFVYDRPESAQAIAEILEFANSQLLELRTYDALLDRELDEIYKMQPGRTSRSLRGQREAERAATLRYMIVDVLELIDRSSNALKIVGDAYYARIYRAAAARLGLADWQRQIDVKVASVGEMYRLLTDQARSSRDTFLEIIIIALIALELLVAVMTLVR
ncbi:MAG TPA: hypothetical protein VKT72_01195 [Candidatus Baltobacteraceae bacterium]|nr:hypothetical protein [Candidatus Baltobacteraceae bacterium]